MARFAHPGHALSDVEQACVHCLYMECLLLYEDDPEWQKEHAFLLYWKAAAATTPRHTDEPILPHWRLEEAT